MLEEVCPTSKEPGATHNTDCTRASHASTSGCMPCGPPPAVLRMHASSPFWVPQPHPQFPGCRLPAMPCCVVTLGCTSTLSGVGVGVGAGNRSWWWEEPRGWSDRGSSDPIGAWEFQVNPSKAICGP